jgi:lipopolysaccharide/colanic/teichoic acid biosynthesis glycosyltransferase
MVSNNCDNDLRIFLLQTGVPINDLFYSNRTKAFISKQKNNIVVLPIPINNLRSYLKIYSNLIESANINNELIVFGKNYIRQSKFFIDTNISETEIVGFFICGGFTLLTDAEIGNNKYFHFKRQQLIPINHENKSIFIKLQRLGLNGKQISIYKFRTMFPYAKYLHKELINRFGYNENGKTKNDYRITKVGRFLRKYYLDEIPQLINLLRGDIKLVGCRPVSRTFLENYPEEIYNLRLQQKPGLISPAIADNAKTVKEVIDAEYKFLLNITRAPVKTMLLTFVNALINVLSGVIKSQ